MQGTFSRRHWCSVLDPQLDEETEAKVREQDAQDALAPQDPPVDRPRPIPPSTRFECKDATFFVIPGDEPARVGRLGHYLVPYTVEGGLAVPFPRPAVEFAPPRPAPAGAPDPPPDPRFCAPGAHYRVPDGSYWEVGRDALVRELEAAEASDLQFARRMEGLCNAELSVYWACLDTDFNPADRQAVLDQFMGKYLDRFYSQLDPAGDMPVERVVEEGVYRHRALCAEWVKRHYKALTPAVTAPAEALAGEFYDAVLERLAPGPRPTRMELARVFMRDERLASDFALCLYSYATSLEQARGGRNASYKQMNVAYAARVMAYKRFGDKLAAALPWLAPACDALQADHARFFSRRTVDWHAVMGQMPQVHRAFEASAPRATVDGAPWNYGRL